MDGVGTGAAVVKSPHAFKVLVEDNLRNDAKGGGDRRGVLKL